MRDSQRSKVYAAERAAFQSDGFYSPDWSLEECWTEAQRVLRRKVLQKHWGVSVTSLASKTKVPVNVTPDYYHWDTSKKVISGVERRSLEVASNSGARGGGNRISLPKWGRNKYVVSHELAHCVANPWDGHNWRFCAAYLDIVKYMVGKEAADALKQEFKNHRVKFRPPRKRAPMSEEQKAAARLRLGHARAVKQAKAEESRDLELTTGSN